MKVQRYMVGQLMTNSYLVVCETTGESILIDPGGYSPELDNAIDKTTLTTVVLTHGHFDHIAGLGSVLEHCKVPVLIHELDAPMLTDPNLNGSFMIGTEISTAEATSFLSHGDTIQCGESMLEVAHTPGHSPGGISLIANGSFVLSGDTLFMMSVGRWDLAGGDFKTLMQSIRATYIDLPDKMELYPGHGESSTMGFEKLNNQFITEGL
ncbi:MBL fold metallo-hydrolase [Candidatus Latescibacterota bacterium]